MDTRKLRRVFLFLLPVLICLCSMPAGSASGPAPGDVPAAVQARIHALRQAQLAQVGNDNPDGPVCWCEGCTSILVGKAASIDGATMTSHSCDSTSDHTWMTIVPASH